MAFQAGEVRAQAAEPEQPGADTAAVDTTPHKKGGLFGKVKSVAKNKTVQSVAKVAACTMVPGGQVIAGAIDAAGVAAGTSCMPGMDGMAGAGMAAQAGAAAAIGGTGRGAPVGLSGYEAMDGVGEEQMVACMGLTPEEYEAYANPTHGEARQPTRDEMKRQAQVAKKIDMNRYQTCMMQASRGGLEH